MAPDKFVVGVRCAGPVAAACDSALVDVLWMAWLQAAGGGAPPAAAAPTTGEDGPRERLVALLQELLKQQLVSLFCPHLCKVTFRAVAAIPRPMCCTRGGCMPSCGLPVFLPLVLHCRILPSNSDMQIKLWPGHKAGGDGDGG